MCEFQKQIQQIMNACPACDTLSPEAVVALLPRDLRKKLVGVRVFKTEKTNGPRQRNIQYFVGFKPIYKSLGEPQGSVAYFETCSGWGATPTNPRRWSVGGRQEGIIYSVGRPFDEKFISL